ncbi:MAG: hypothetical protein KBA79_03805 [Candidatus Cloacimonetes bacterium]|nr:hypothetical protein [Candidatus Cloacimonadota bacterium]HNZ06542.1 hypothetical protein [Candidatus Cloacimonadota bacterium]HOH78902.1 hypothetical protein [Candidatus Cloacimonadota bacterium]
MRSLLAALMLLLGIACLSADAGIYQSLENDDNLSVGDRFLFNIKAEYSINRVVVPDTLSNFKVIDSQRVSEAGSPAWYRLTIVPLLPGYHSFPALKVEPVRPDNSVAYTDRFRVNVIPVRAESDTTLVDIKPPLAYPMQAPGWLYLVLAGLVPLLALAYFLSKPGKAKTEAPVQAPAPAPPVKPSNWKVALEQLDRLMTEDLLAQGMVALHHFQLAMILRSFLEKEFRIAALEMTTSELREAMQRVNVQRSSEVNFFLNFCDRAKFAKHIPTPEDSHGMEQWLRDYLLGFEILAAQRMLDKPRGPANAPVR